MEMTEDEIGSIDPPIPPGLEPRSQTVWATAYIGEFVRTGDRSKAVSYANRQIRLSVRLVTAEKELSGSNGLENASKARKFNPNHDHAGRFTGGHGGGGHGGGLDAHASSEGKRLADHADPAGEIAKQAPKGADAGAVKEWEADARERHGDLTQAQHRETTELHGEQAKEAAKLAAAQKQDIKDLAHDHLSEQRSQIKDHNEATQDQTHQHGRERAGHDPEMEPVIEMHARHAGERADLEADHEYERSEMRGRHAGERSELAKEHAEASKDQAKEHRTQRETLADQQHAERVEFVTDLVRDFHDTDWGGGTDG